MNRNRNPRPAGPQPIHRDGTLSWAVDAFRRGGKRERLCTRYVRSADAETAVEIGRAVLAGKGWPRHILKARPATAGELGMVPIGESR